MGNAIFEFNNKRLGYVFEQQKEDFYHLSTKRLAHHSFIFSTHLINSFTFLGFEWDRGGYLDHIEANFDQT